MTTYAILHRGDPERCIRFFRQYCKVWQEDYIYSIRHFFKSRPSLVLSAYPYCKIESDNYDNCLPCIATEPDEGDTFIDFENNPRRRAL